METPSLKRFNAQLDIEELEKYPEMDREEDIYLAITRQPGADLLHWRIAWRAYDSSGKLSGYKIMEVKYDRTLCGDQSLPGDLQYRFSFRLSDSESASIWKTYLLGALGKEDRDNLFGFGESWAKNGDGNCITCVRETIENMIESGGFGAQAEHALGEIEQAKEDDLKTGHTSFADLHNKADNALDIKRVEYMDKDGILQKFLDKISRG